MKYTDKVKAFKQALLETTSLRSAALLAHKRYKLNRACQDGGNGSDNAAWNEAIKGGNNES